MRPWFLILLACSSSSAPAPTAPAKPCTSVATCETACASNDLAACARAAELLFDGAEVDHARSFAHAKRACDGGLPFGCTMLGLHYQDGLGTEWAPQQAIAVYTRACAGNDGTGCYNLSSVYSGGQGVDPDFAKAKQYNELAKQHWEAACAGPAPRWCTNLGFILEDTDQQRALELYDRACKHDVPVGCTEATRVRRKQGKVVGAAYIAEMQKICDGGEPIACLNAGALLAVGEAGVVADPVRGMALARRSCDLGFKRACAAIGEDALGKGDVATGIRDLERACDRAFAPACMMLVRHYGVARAGDALPFARRACHMGDGDGCAVVAGAYRQGLAGLAVDDAQYVRWITESCRMGIMLACDVLIEREIPLPVPAEVRPKVLAGACGRNVPHACP